MTLNHPTVNHATVSHRHIITWTVNHRTYNHAAVKYLDISSRDISSPACDRLYSVPRSNIPISEADDDHGRGENYESAIFPTETYNHSEAEQAALQEHYGPQALQCHHPTLWSFLESIAQDLQMQRTAFLQGIAGAQPSVSKR